jgi:Mn2+/Fe2+ NRAMP family transporter
MEEQPRARRSQHPGQLSPGDRTGDPGIESAATYWFFAIALFGAAMTPYEVFFFSSGAVDEHWTTKDLAISRLNGVRTTRYSAVLRSTS